MIVMILIFRRFPEQYKDKEPFNVLTFLDPRQRLLYAETEELQDEIMSVLCKNPVYDKVQCFLGFPDQQAQTGLGVNDHAHALIGQEIHLSSSCPIR
jgi:hypothetical protein